MKKLMLFLILICVSGCSTEDKYSDYEHYDLKGKENIFYTYVSDDKLKQVYVVADITEKNSEGGVNGLFYKVGDNDYILLDEFVTCGSGRDYLTSTATYFYGNKLYIVRCLGALILEYTLNRENTEKKEVTFDTSRISEHYVIVSRIEKIEKKYIYLEAVMEDEVRSDVDIVCSLDDYKCVLAE